MTTPDLAAEPRVAHPPCDGCGKEDDHPRHVVIYSITDDSLNKNFHFDCCVNDSPCSTCQPVLDAAGGATGLDLLPHIAAVHGAATDLNEGIAPVSDNALNRKG